MSDRNTFQGSIGRRSHRINSIYSGENRGFRVYSIDREPEQQNFIGNRNMNDIQGQELIPDLRRPRRSRILLEGSRINQTPNITHRQRLDSQSSLQNLDVRRDSLVNN